MAHTSPMAKLPLKLGEFTILPVSLPPMPSYPIKAIHCLYLRQHNPKIPAASDTRSLFLVNVPIDSTELHFRVIFNTLVGAGRFESITFESERQAIGPMTTENDAGKKGRGMKRKRGDDRKAITRDEGQMPKVWDRELHRSGGTAVAVMVDEKGVEAVLKAVKKVHKNNEYPVWGAGIEDKVPKLGSLRYFIHHKLRYPDKTILQASVDAFMTAFNEQEEDAAKVSKRARNVPDEDGFVTVTKGGRTGPASRGEAEEARKKQLEKEEEKKKTMGDFYRFQGRERRKEQQNELVRKFEEDRKKIESMRKERRGRFRPE